MRKLSIGLLITSILAICLPYSFAAEETEVSFISQSRVWITDRSNLTFSFTESSGSGISNAEVEISSSALLGRSAIRAIISKPSSVEYQKIFETDAITETDRVFQFTLPGNRLEFSGAGAYALRITLYIRGEAKRVTSFISFLPKKLNINELKVATVLPLNVFGGLTPTESVLNDKAANSFVQNQSLSTILNLGDSISNVTWLLDSDTLKLAQSVLANREISRPEPHELSAEQISGAESWLASLQITANTENSFVVPAEEPLALKELGLNRLAQLSITNSNFVTDYFAGRAFDLISVAPKGGYTDFESDWLSNQGIKFNILNSKAYPPQNSTFTPNGVVQDGSGNKAPVVDNYASRLFTEAISSSSNSGTYQAAFAGDLLITALEQPALNRFIVLMPDTNASGITDAKFLSAISAIKSPWINSVKLSKFKTQDIGSRNRESVSTQVSESAKNLIKESKATKENLASLISGAVEETQIDAAILRLTNSRVDEKTLQQLQNQTRDFLSGLNDAVRIMSAGSVVFPSESAKVPITVRNDLSVPIQIRIITTGVPAVRVIPDAVAEMNIAPGRRKSIEIPTRLIGTDTAYLQLQIVDMNGKKIGEPNLIQVSSSAYAQAAAWVVGAAFALLLLFAIRNTIKRIRSSRIGSGENMKL